MPRLSSRQPFLFRFALGIALGATALFGFQMFQEYRINRAMEIANRMTERSQQAMLEARQRQEAENLARQQRLELQRMKQEEERIVREAKLDAGRDRAEYIKQLTDPKCQFWLDNLRTTGSDKAKVMVDYYCPR